MWSRCENKSPLYLRRRPPDLGPREHRCCWRLQRWTAGAVLLEYIVAKASIEEACFPLGKPVRLQHRHAERREVLLALAPRFIARGLLRRPAAGGRLRAARERLALLHVLEQRVDQILLRGVHLPEAPRLVELPVPDELLEFLHGDGRDVGVFFGGEQVRLAQRLAQHLEVLALRELLEVLRHLQRTSCGFLEHGCWRMPLTRGFFFWRLRTRFVAASPPRAVRRGLCARGGCLF